MMPEGDEIEKRFPVALDDVEHGVQLNKELDLLRHDPEVPEDRGGPETELENDADDLCRISHEDVNRGGDPAYAQGQDTHGKEIIECLQPIQTKRHLMQQDKGQQHNKKNSMCYEGTYELYNRQDTQREDHFFNQMRVIDYNSGRAVDNLREGVPDSHSCSHPDDKRDIAFWRRFKPDTEDEPHDEDYDQRIDKGPEKAKHRTYMLRSDITFRHFKDQESSLNNGQEEIPEAL